MRHLHSSWNLMHGLLNPDIIAPIVYRPLHLLGMEESAVRFCVGAQRNVDVVELV